MDVLARDDVEDTAHTEGEPGVCGSGLDRDNGVEDGDGVGEDEGDDPEKGGATHPRSPRADAVGGDLVSSLHLLHADDEHVLDTDVTVGKGTSQDSGEDNTVSSLGVDVRSGTKSGRSRVLAGKTVNTGGKHGVESGGKADQPGKREGEILARVLHLSHVGDVRVVTGIGEDDLEDGVEDVAEARVVEGLDLRGPVLGGLDRVGESKTDRDDEDGADKGDDGRRTAARDELDGSRNAEEV